jgi:hypothetical protein
LHNELWDKGGALAEDNVNFSPRFSPKRLRLNAEEYRKMKRPVPPLACATVSALVSAPAELVFEPRMPGEDQRQTPATVPRLFDELFEAPQCLGMQVMPVVNEQSDRLLAAAHHFHEGPLALFRFAGQVAVFIRRQIIILHNGALTTPICRMIDA